MREEFEDYINGEITSAEGIVNRLYTSLERELEVRTREIELLEMQLTRAEELMCILESLALEDEKYIREVEQKVVSLERQIKEAQEYRTTLFKDVSRLNKVYVGDIVRL